MARTTRYGAIRRFLEEQDAKIAKRQSSAPAAPPEVKEGTNSWIHGVVGPLRLCPFAAKQPVSIIVCNLGEDEEGDLKDCAWFVYKQARELVQDKDGATFQSTLVVFPHYTQEIGPLYKEIITSHEKYIGSVDDRVPKKDPFGMKQRVQAIPFECFEVNEQKQSKGLPTRPVTALAPWTTIQLIRYSDFEKLPKKMRQRILDRNDDAMNKLDLTKKLEMLRECRYCAQDNENHETDTTKVDANEGNVDSVVNKKIPKLLSRKRRSERDDEERRVEEKLSHN